MKVIFLNITGKSGSTGKIVNDIATVLKAHGHQTYILYGHTETIDESGYIQISKPIEAKITSQLSKLGRAVYKGNPVSIYRIKKIINNIQPDIVHVHCINGFICNVYRLFKYLAKNEIKTVVTHHAEFFYTGSCPYSFDCKQFINKECKKCPRPQYAAFNKIFCSPHNNWIRMYKAINSFKPNNIRFVSVSPWVHSRAILSPIVNKYIDNVILNGIDTSVFKYRNDTETKDILSQVDNIREHIVLHVTSRFSANDKIGTKGGGYVTELARRMPHITFVIVASVISDMSNLPSNMYIWGKTKNQIELSQLYSKADLTIITSKRETFSMVVAESLCCGTPIIGFEAGGPETIGISDFCTFVKHGDIDTLKQLVQSSVEHDYDKQYISKISQSFYSKEQMGEVYLKLYTDLIIS